MSGIRTRAPKAQALALGKHQPRGESKQSQQNWSVHLPVSPLLSRIADRYVQHEKACVRERKRGSPKPKLTDEQVIEMRRHAEIDRWTAQRCAEHYGLTLEHAKRHLDYTTRSRLIPSLA